MIETINKINTTYCYLEQLHQRPPNAEDIESELDIRTREVKQSMKNSGRHLSMDAPLKEGESFSLYDVVSESESPRPDKDLMKASLNTEIERALDTLTQKESDVIRLNFGIGNQPPMTLEEIGSIYDLNRSRYKYRSLLQVPIPSTSIQLNCLFKYLF